MPKFATHLIRKTKLEQPKYSALTIAKYLFSLDPQREYFRGDKKISTGAGFSSPLLGNWRLNQMLYLLQVFHYVKCGSFLFKDDLYAFDNGFLVYDAYRNFWLLYNNEWFDIEVPDIKEKPTKNFLQTIFHHFKESSSKNLEEWYTSDPSWIEAWLEGKKEPKVDFNQKALFYYDTFLPNHLRYIEEIS